MSRYFISSPDQPRVRRAADAVAIVVGVVLVAWTGFTADRVLAIEEALVSVTDSFPSWFDQLYEVVYFVGAMMVVALFVAVLAQGRRHLDLLRDMTLALLTSFGLAVLLVWWGDGSISDMWPDFSAAEPEPVFPILRVAVVTSVIAVSGPHLARPIRRLPPRRNDGFDRQNNHEDGRNEVHRPLSRPRPEEPREVVPPEGRCGTIQQSHRGGEGHRNVHRPSSRANTVSGGR